MISSLLSGDTVAAQESISSGLYVIWCPLPSCSLTSSAADEIRSGIGQCSRVGSASVCQCGHALSAHKAVVPKAKGGYNKPPSCSSCSKCKGFAYSPAFPGEVGQPWLLQRKDFNLSEWRSRVRNNPHDYACIGCEQLVSNHETIFETKSARVQRGAAVDREYLPTIPPVLTPPLSSDIDTAVAIAAGGGGGGSIAAGNNIRSTSNYINSNKSSINSNSKSSSCSSRSRIGDGKIGGSGGGPY